MTGGGKKLNDIDERLKHVAEISLFGIFMLLGLSVVFYRERMLFTDAPHIVSRILNDGTLQITEHRYGSFITQIFPFAGRWLHMSLKQILILYSASFYLFYIVVAALLVFVYRQYGLAVLLGLYLTLFVSDTFYWPNNEVHQGIAWLLIALAASLSFMAKGRNVVLTAVLFTSSVYLAIWTHPLVMLVAVYLWGYLWLDGRMKIPKQQFVVYSALLLSLSFVKFYYGMHHGYDSGKIETVTQISADQLLHVFSSPQFSYLMKGCVTNYWLFVIITIAGIVAMVKEKRYTTVAFTIAFAAGYVVLLCITYWDARAGRFYLESEYMPLSIIGATPFVYYVLPHVKGNRAVTILAFIFMVRMEYIVHSAPLFTGRIAYMERITARMKEKELYKVIIKDNKRSDSALLLNWGAPVESMFLEAIKGERPQRSFILLDTAQIKTFTTAGRDTLLGAFEKRAAAGLNARYFEMDTSSGYRVMTYEELMN